MADADLIKIEINKDNKTMKKALKTAGRVMLVIMTVIILLLLGTFIYNRIMLKKERPLLEAPLGEMVEVDGNKMCVYIEGSGEHTLVFLSGSGTASPILDFRSLGRLLSDDNKIVVIEKFGYGFSDIVDDERSFDTILRQDREALAKAGIDGPFVLCPHSMSGLEAILWAQEYPDEVEAIVGLDAALPRAYDNFDFKGSEKYEKLAAAAREVGIVRFFYSDSALPSGLTKEEKAIYRAIACNKAVNTDVRNEGNAIPKACEMIDSRPAPDIPTLLFVSNGKEVGVDNWVDIQKEYAAALTDAKVIELDCGHYVHNFEQEEISKDIKELLKTI